MKTKDIFFLLLSGTFVLGCSNSNKQPKIIHDWGKESPQPNLSWAQNVGSWELPNKKVVSANLFGALPDSTILSTEAIQKAIDYCEINGGGTVVLQPGYYQTGALFIKS